MLLEEEEEQTRCSAVFAQTEPNHEQSSSWLLAQAFVRCSSVLTNAQIKNSLLGCKPGAFS